MADDLTWRQIGRRRPLWRLPIVCRHHPDKVLIQPVITLARVPLVDSPKTADIKVIEGPNGQRFRRRCGEEDPPGSGHRCRITIDFRKDRVDAVLLRSGTGTRRRGARGGSRMM